MALINNRSHHLAAINEGIEVRRYVIGTVKCAWELATDVEKLAEGVGTRVAAALVKRINYDVDASEFHGL
ncbi:hypothetical protein NW762_003661 [Fusarium torreyae]|uniref:Uncharacterized protein n=1 Tax=Fusarium torreyae TaxID=1237075 RepID=A0A9W8S9R3_9HYPO|nr:hypothetical protein NW762_003661 [Fusarium torreyae]